MNLYITCDKIGTETGGGIVTKNEYDALSSLDTTDILNPSNHPIPFDSDEEAVQQLQDKDYRRAHLYAGTFTKLVKKLKERGTKVSYTVAAHDVDVSRSCHEELGMSFDYPHLNEPDKFQQYIQGYKDADKVICPSAYSKSVMINQGFDADKIVVIPHGCHLPNKTKPIPVKPFIVGYMGSAGADKGLIYLIKAWAKLNYKDGLLVLAGRDTPLLLPWLRQIGKGSIHLAGWMNSPEDLYNQCSVYCQPSATEGFGCEVIEAMAHARPVICSKGAGAADCITHEQDGLVVEKRNIDALAGAIDYYKKNYDKILEHAKAAREKAKNYTWDKIRNQYCETWRGII